MADGFNRFHQPGAGQYFHPPQNHRNLNRATSPHGSRRPFNNTDTPSPSRSPASASHNYSMYNHNNGYQTQQHGIGSGYSRHMPQMPKYQGNHPQHHNQMNQHQGQQHHHGGNIGHQHNSSSGGYSHATAHLGPYGQDHIQNGNIDELHQDDYGENTNNEHWQEQLRLAQESRENGAPHQRAKMHGSKGTHGFVPSGLISDPDAHTYGRNHEANGEQNARQTWHELDFGGQGLCALSPALFNYTFLHRLVLTHNNLSRLPSAIGKLKSLEHLDVSHNNLVELPEEIGMLTKLESLWLFANQIQTFPDQLGFLFKLKTLGIEGNPLAEELKAKMRQDGTTGLIRHLRENMEKPPPPLERPWEVVEEVTRQTSGAEKLSVLSYNILCQKYATPSQYGYVPDEALQWDYRKDLILAEILSHDTDIVCLQELDKISYDEFFRSKLAERGYKGYYAQKGRADTFGEKAPSVDGCGTFWKNKTYILLDSQQWVLGRKAVERPRAKASADMLNRVWQRDDIATVVLLENRVTGSRLIVAQTHLFWDPAFRDVKLIQAAVLVEELSKLADQYAEKPACGSKEMFRFSNADGADEEPTPEYGPSLEYTSGTQIPLLICGDFNASGTSAVYDLLAHGSLPSHHPDLFDKNYSDFSDSGMRHPFSLKSAYGSIGELPFTNYTPGFVDVLDYIWYSSNALRVTSVLGKVDEDYLAKVPGFPNFHFPSDHLPLCAEFLVEKRKNPREKVKVDFGSSSTRR